MAGYMNPVTNAPLSATGALIYAEKAEPSVKTLKEFAIDFINPTKNILQKTPFKVKDPMSAGIAAMEAFGIVPFIGGVGKIGSRTLRKIQARRGDDTMGGGGGPTNIVDDSVALDMAGYKCSIEEFAEKNISNYKSGQAFLDALKSSKQLDNTIIFMVSDNGEMLGQQGARGKLVHWEESIRVPTLIYHPDIKKQQQCESIISNIYIYSQRYGKGMVVTFSHTGHFFFNYFNYIFFIIFWSLKY